jgi:hypothetical protein
MDKFFKSLKNIYDSGYKMIQAVVNAVLPDDDDLYITFPTSIEKRFNNAPMLICHPKAWRKVQRQYPMVFIERKGECQVDLEAAMIQGVIHEDPSRNTQKHSNNYG